MKQFTILIAILLGFLALSVQAQNAWINEIHYDNDGDNITAWLAGIQNEAGNQGETSWQNPHQHSYITMKH